MGAKANFPKTKLGLPFKPGFSWIELLIAIAIVLVVEAIALPSVLGSKTAARRAGVAENARTINKASVAGGKGYPPSVPSLGGLGTAATRDPVHRMGATLAYMRRGDV